MTLEEHSQRMMAFTNNAKIIIDKCLFVSANQFEGQLEKRVFSRGEDENNRQIGEYSPAYAAFRRKEGRQTSYVDLFMEGNLKNSIQTKRIQGGYAVAFSNPKQAKIARDNEKRFKGAEGTIFDISAEERKQALKAQNVELLKQIDIFLG